MPSDYLRTKILFLRTTNIAMFEVENVNFVYSKVKMPWLSRFYSGIVPLMTLSGI